MFLAAVGVMLILLDVERRVEAFRHGPDDAAFVTFLEKRLNNHSYVSSDSVGENESDSVQCHSHLHTCCSTYQGPDRGTWYDPSGKQLEFLTPAARVFQSRGTQRVDLRRGKGHVISPGLYRCDINVGIFRGPTMMTIYVGLYSSTSGGKSLHAPHHISNYYTTRL